MSVNLNFAEVIKAGFKFIFYFIKDPKMFTALLICVTYVVRQIKARVPSLNSAPNR